MDDPSSGDKATDPPVLDSGWVKSGWVFFGAGPFAFMAAAGLALTSADIVLVGLAEPWWNQAIGFTLLLALTVQAGLAHSGLQPRAEPA